MLPLATCFVVWWSIWCRRYTWPFRWERATSLGTGLLGIATLLISPPVYSITCAWLYSITHVWNLPYLIAHLLRLGATGAVVYSAVAKLSDDEEMGCWATTRLRIPGIVTGVALTALFVFSKAARNCHNDVITMPVTPFLTAFWVIYGLAIMYLMYHGIHALIDLWYDPESRLVCNIYMVAAVLMIISMAGRVLIALVGDLQTKPMMQLIAAAASLAVCTFAGGAGYSWHRRVRWFGNRRGVQIALMNERMKRGRPRINGV